MKNTNTQSMNLSNEVTEALSHYNSVIDSALDAVQKLESIYITKHLTQLFGVDETKVARTLEKDYLVEYA
ncbi:hypothetical protein N9J72_00265 [Candidatus Gracilibacteria bacterium]|nr:hypothetical protein [Candidatus Gracilibacteria bacterium]